MDVASIVEIWMPIRIVSVLAYAYRLTRFEYPDESSAERIHLLVKIVLS